MQPTDVSTFHLMIELIYSGKAEIVPELSPFEPFEPSAIVSELEARTREEFGMDVARWIGWFMASSATQSDKETLELLYRFKIAQAPIVKRILARRRGGESSD
jgi:hypothetical protein